MNSRKNREKKHKLIRKEKESTVIEFNLSKAVILLIIIGVIIAGILTKEIVTTIIETNQREILANEEETITETNAQNSEIRTLAEKNGDLGYIHTADLKEVKTGTGPFDENDEPGNDSSEDNDIVRSFDQITWTYQLNFALKNPEEEASLTGGVIKITADLPEELAEIVEWDIESMKWLSNSTISENGIQLTGEYSMNEEQITIPGNQDVIFVLKVKNAVNGTKIKPTFTFILEGNEESEKKEVEAEKEITVSATGRYNIQLHRNTFLADKTTVDYGEGEVTGRMYGYGFAVQLYNNTYSEEENPYAKGIKGIEYPQGEISFDIDLKLERTKINSEIIEDVTNEITPIIWNYRANNSTTTDLSGNIEERDMYYKDNNGTIHDGLLPKGIDTGDRSMSVYNSGDIKIEQEGATLHVTINNYEFDVTYPQYNFSYEDNPNRGKIYQDNVGTFSIGFIQIFVPEPVETIQDVNSYYLSLEINNFKANSSKEEITKQEVTTDDSSRVQYIISQSGNKDAFIDMGAFSNRGRDGDVAVFRSQVIDVSLTTSRREL